MDCIVCYEPTNCRTPCHHVLCDGCKAALSKDECPYCRQLLFRKGYKDMEVPFYFFVKWFSDHYKKNGLFELLQMGIHDDRVLHENTMYFFPNEFANCTWTENYEKTITVRVFTVKEVKNDELRVMFQTLGLDDTRTRQFCNTWCGEPIYMDSFSWWIQKKILKT